MAVSKDRKFRSNDAGPFNGTLEGSQAEDLIKNRITDGKLAGLGTTKVDSAW